MTVPLAKLREVSGWMRRPGLFRQDIIERIYPGASFFLAFNFDPQAIACPSVTDLHQVCRVVVGEYCQTVAELDQVTVSTFSIVAPALELCIEMTHAKYWLSIFFGDGKKLVESGFAVFYETAIAGHAIAQAFRPVLFHLRIAGLIAVGPPAPTQKGQVGKACPHLSCLAGITCRSRELKKKCE